MASNQQHSILGVSDVAILNWVRAEARNLPKPAANARQVIITLDEMWHFLQKKTHKLWIWRAYDPIERRTIDWVVLVAVMTPLAKSSSTKSVSKARRLSPTIGTVIIASFPGQQQHPPFPRPLSPPHKGRFKKRGNGRSVVEVIPLSARQPWKPRCKTRGFQAYL